MIYSNLIAHMVIFCNMQIKKSFFVKIFVTVIILISPTMVSAAGGEFTLHPSGGDAYDRGEGFTVDILIDSNGESLVKARSVITFDPELVKVTEAKRNNSLFLTWPVDESTIDNENGVVMLTGFTQSGTGEPYLTEGDSDVFARLTFEILEEGELTLDWEFSGNDESFNSVMITDGSPPQNVLETKPDSGTYTLIIGESTDTSTDAPDTGLEFEISEILIGFVLMVLGMYLMITKPAPTKRNGTVVVYED